MTKRLKVHSSNSFRKALYLDNSVKDRARAVSGFKITGNKMVKTHHDEGVLLNTISLV